MNNEARFWKSEYERLRRNKNKEIQRTREQISIFFDKTWNLLHELGMNDEEIREYYDRGI